MSTERRCIGFGDREGRCTNTAGTPWTDVWCMECDEQRRRHISKRLFDIQHALEGPAREEHPQ